MRIGIAGVTGRMGRLLVEEGRAAGHEVVGGTTHRAPAPDGVPTLSLPDLAAAADVVIDFTHAATAAPHAARHGRAPARPGCSAPPASPPRMKRPSTPAAQRIPVVYAANFGPGVNLAAGAGRALGAALPGRRSTMPRSSRCTTARRWTPPPAPRSASAAPSPKGRGVHARRRMQSGRDGHTGAAPDRRHRLRRPARRPGRRRAYADFRRRRRAHRADPPRLRPPGFRRRRGAGRALGRAPARRAVIR